MSRFDNKDIYVIIPAVDLTEEMMNLMRAYYNVSGDVSSNSLRKSTDESEVLLKIKKNNAHAHEYAALKAYRWYNQEDMLTVIEGGDW